MQVTLSEQELVIVKRLIQERLVALSHEIHQTDNRDFKHALEQEEETLKALTARL